MRYKLAIFDLDGTILNTLEDLTDSVNYSLGQFGFPKRTMQEVRRFVGNGIRKLIERAVPVGTDDDTVQAVFECFNGYYKIHCADKTKPYDGIEELLEKLKAHNCLTAVVSNKADFAVQELCEKYFPGSFDFVVGERSGIKRKPCPDSVMEVLDKLHVKKEEAVYIGDSDVDIMTAKNAGMDAILVDWGFKDKEFLIEKGAEIIVDSAQELYLKIAKNSLPQFSR